MRVSQAPNRVAVAEHRLQRVAALARVHALEAAELGGAEIGAIPQALPLEGRQTRLRPDHRAGQGPQRDLVGVARRLAAVERSCERGQRSRLEPPGEAHRPRSVLREVAVEQRPQEALGGADVERTREPRPLHERDGPLEGGLRASGARVVGDSRNPPRRSDRGEVEPGIAAPETLEGEEQRVAGSGAPDGRDHLRQLDLGRVAEDPLREQQPLEAGPAAVRVAAGDPLDQPGRVRLRPRREALAGLDSRHHARHVGEGRLPERPRRRSGEPPPGGHPYLAEHSRDVDFGPGEGAALHAPPRGLAGEDVLEGVKALRACRRLADREAEGEALPRRVQPGDRIEEADATLALRSQEREQEARGSSRALAYHRLPQGRRLCAPRQGHGAVLHPEAAAEDGQHLRVPPEERAQDIALAGEDAQRLLVPGREAAVEHRRAPVGQDDGGQIVLLGLPAEELLPDGRGQRERHGGGVGRRVRGRGAVRCQTPGEEGLPPRPVPAAGRLVEDAPAIDGCVRARDPGEDPRAPGDAERMPASAVVLGRRARGADPEDREQGEDERGLHREGAYPAPGALIALLEAAHERHGSGESTGAPCPRPPGIARRATPHASRCGRAVQAYPSVRRGGILPSAPGRPTREDLVEPRAEA